MKLTKFIFVFLVLAMALGALAGCDKEDTVGEEDKYDAVLYSKAHQWMSKEALDKLPFRESFIIKNQAEFDKYVADFPESVDFETETVIVYVFMDANPHDRTITNIEEKDGEVKVTIANVGHKEGEDCAVISEDKQCFMLKLDKMEITKVIFYNEQGRIVQ